MDRSELLAAYRALPLHRRHQALRVACDYAVEVLQRERADLALPSRALDAVDRKLGGDTVDARPVRDAYRERVATMPAAIERAERAIHHLFEAVFASRDDERVLEQTLAGDDTWQEWWTRTWDAWASRAVPPYPATELDPATFDALAAGDIAAAVAASAPGTRLHAALLALAGRTDDAAAEAARVLGAEPDD